MAFTRDEAASLPLARTRPVWWNLHGTSVIFPGKRNHLEVQKIAGKMLMACNLQMTLLTDRRTEKPQTGERERGISTRPSPGAGSELHIEHRARCGMPHPPAIALRLQRLHRLRSRQCRLEGVFRPRAGIADKDMKEGGPMVRFLGLCLAIVASLGAMKTGQAQILSSTNFDSFSLGSVNGQGGWGITGPYDQEVVNIGPGNNALRVSNRVISGSFGDQLFAPRPNIFVGESSTANAYPNVIGNQLSVSFRFSAATTALQNDARSTFSTDDGNGGRQSFAALLGCGAGLVCVETFDVNPDGSFAGPITIASNLSGWHKLEIVVEFNDGPNNDVVRYLIDDVVVHTNTSWEAFYVANQPALHPFGVANQTLLVRQSSGPCVNCQGFYIDDVVVAAVPEPATAAILGASLIGLAGARRRLRRRRR